MAKKRCGVCREPYRGKATMVLAGAKLERMRACPTCSKRAVAVIPGTPQTACKCGQPATTCAGCGNVGGRKEKAASVKEIVQMIDGLITVLSKRETTSDFLDGKIEGLETARDKIKSGVWT